MSPEFSRLLEVAGFLGAAFAAAVAAYQGAARQTAKGLQPLVGDPPIPSAVPLAQRVDEALAWLRRLDERQIQAEREVADVRDDVGRNTREIESLRETSRGYEGRLSRLEHRADNIERRCGMKHRAEDGPSAGSPT